MRKIIVGFGSAGVLVYAALEAIFNRQRGTDTKSRWLGMPKIITYLIMSTAFFLLVVPATIYFSPYSLWWVLPILFVGNFGFSILRDAPSRGECFPHKLKDTSKEDFSFGVKEIANLIMGYKYTSTIHGTDREVDWKQCAMGIYFVIWSLPRYMFLSVFFGLILGGVWQYLPLFLVLAWPSNYLGGLIYRKYHDIQYKRIMAGELEIYDATMRAEYVFGGLRGLIDGTTLGIMVLGTLLL